MDWPIHYKDRLYFANLKSNVGIVTLWSPLQTILPKLNQEHFYVGGQLYSKRGINFMIRNILANPVLDTILICGANLSGSAESLVNFVEKGIDENNNVIGVEKSPIDIEIDKSALELFRKNVKIVNLAGEFKVDVIQKELEKHFKGEIKPWAEPQTFPEAEKVTAEKFPSEKTTYNIRSESIKDAWVQILRHLMKFGSKKGMIKVGEVRELVNIVTVIEDEDPYKPDIPEWFNFNIDDLKLYYKGFFSKDAESEDYNYGQRIFSHPLGIPNEDYKSPNNTKMAGECINALMHQCIEDKKTIDELRGFTLNQIEEVYLKLKSYKYDRGAVVSIWNPWVDNISKGWQSDENVKSAGNVPCMTQLQFAYRDHKLHLTAYFRSNDMFDAWPRNAFALRKLQFDLAKKLDLKPGLLTTISSLGQIYEPNFDEAKKIVEKFKDKAFCRNDMRGNYIIEVEGKEIVAKHTDTSGNEILEEFRIDGTLPKSAMKMADILVNNLGLSEIVHALDIGRELMKAEIAVKNGLKYTQDKDLEIR
jgi:thymidylate synthase